MTNTSPQLESHASVSEEPAKPFAIGRAALAMVCCVGLAMLAINLVLRGFGWESQLDYSMAAGLISGGAAIVALIPVWLLSRKSVQGGAMGFLAGMLIRMGLCGAAVIVGGRIEGVSQNAWSLWVAGWYVLVLTVEVALVGRYVARSRFVSARHEDGGVRTDVKHIDCRVAP